ncbi:MAG: hypothetical protein ACLRIL_08470 [Fusicatenibacter saccharivorans]
MLEQKLRQTDYVGMLDGGLHVLLSDTDEEECAGCYYCVSRKLDLKSITCE